MIQIDRDACDCEEQGELTVETNETGSGVEEVFRCKRCGYRFHVEQNF